MLTVIVLSVSLLGGQPTEKAIHFTWESCEAHKNELVDQQGYQILKGDKSPLRVYSCTEEPIKVQ